MRKKIGYAGIIIMVMLTFALFMGCDPLKAVETSIATSTSNKKDSKTLSSVKKVLENWMEIKENKPLTEANSELEKAFSKLLSLKADNSDYKNLEGFEEVWDLYLVLRQFFGLFDNSERNLSYEKDIYNKDGRVFTIYEYRGDNKFDDGSGSLENINSKACEAGENENEDVDFLIWDSTSKFLTRIATNPDPLPENVESLNRIQSGLEFDRDKLTEQYNTYPERYKCIGIDLAYRNNLFRDLSFRVGQDLISQKNVDRLAALADQKIKEEHWDIIDPEDVVARQRFLENSPHAASVKRALGAEVLRGHQNLYDIEMQERQDEAARARAARIAEANRVEAERVAEEKRVKAEELERKIAANLVVWNSKSLEQQLNYHRGSWIPHDLDMTLITDADIEEMQKRLDARAKAAREAEEAEEAKAQRIHESVWDSVSMEDKIQYHRIGYYSNPKRIHWGLNLRRVPQEDKDEIQAYIEARHERVWKSLSTETKMDIAWGSSGELPLGIDYSMIPPEEIEELKAARHEGVWNSLSMEVRTRHYRNAGSYSRWSSDVDWDRVSQEDKDEIQAYIDEKEAQRVAEEAAEAQRVEAEEAYILAEHWTPLSLEERFSLMTAYPFLPSPRK